jgi:hypothetical protein
MTSRKVFFRKFPYPLEGFGRVQQLFSIFSRTMRAILSRMEPWLLSYKHIRSKQDSKEWSWYAFSWLFADG